MRFEAEVSLDMAYSERKERLSLGGRIKDGKHVKRLLRNHDVFFLTQLKLRICLEMKKPGDVRIYSPALSQTTPSNLQYAQDLFVTSALY
jgi:hypothetical protein